MCFVLTDFKRMIQLFFKGSVNVGSLVREEVLWEGEASDLFSRVSFRRYVRAGACYSPSRCQNCIGVSWD